MSRRRFAGATGAVAGAVVLGSTGAAGPASAAGPAPAGVWKGGRSANGWPVLAEATEYDIEGSGLSVRLADGDVAVLLLHVARRFHYEIDQLRRGDVRGHRPAHEGQAGIQERYESNHLSGTAISIRAEAYPTGVKGGLYPQELVVVRDILTELDGAVSWGGDFSTPKESHFEIALRSGHPKLKGVARKIRGWNDSPGEGAGAIDAFDTARRARAKAFALRAG
ncbi:M15 family metallopeptidase [Streptomyces sp. SID12488]|nr:M15 family metallopeptidase [Streptomyces sp. SID12488]NEA66458.1 M15 family metallopeptidase [Streptomyces sp. SID12488]